ncbi:MAG: NAD-dependent epimerase/dehydratase family protein [Oligoflexales bacterium]|nr:NAD-dependent epimerase/dehydratase family protein [Oligoflexales bacterium]
MNPSYKVNSGDNEGSSAILVTGGSGYVGTELVKYLASMGETVVSMYRHRLPEPREHVFPVCSDLASEELLAAPLRGVETVIHLAWERNLLGPESGNVSFGLGRNDTKTNNIRLLQNLVAAMEKANTKRIVFVSAHGAAYNAAEPFLREKYCGEICILNSKIPEKVVVRPGIIYGGDQKRDRFMSTIRRILRFPGLYPVPMVNGKLYPLYIGDFVKGLMTLVRRPLQEPNKIIDFLGTEGLKIEEIFKLIAESDNKSSKVGIGSYFGNILLSLIEKDLKSDQNLVRLKNYLVFRKNDDRKLMLDEDIQKILKRQSKRFKEGVRTKKLSKEAPQVKLAPSR